MKLDQICRTCLREKANLKPIFEACVPNMLMSCASIQVNYLPINWNPGLNSLFEGNDQRWLAQSNLHAVPAKRKQSLHLQTTVWEVRHDFKGIFTNTQHLTTPWRLNKHHRTVLQHQRRPTTDLHFPRHIQRYNPLNCGQFCHTKQQHR